MSIGILPVYRCHKSLRAGTVTAIGADTDGIVPITLGGHDGDTTGVSVSSEWVEFFSPQVGDVVVFLNDVMPVKLSQEQFLENFSEPDGCR